MNEQQRVTLTIDRLVLRGFAPDQRDTITAALTAELEQQLQGAAPECLSQSRSLATINAGTVPPQWHAGGIGTGAARHIVGSLLPGSGRPHA